MEANPAAEAILLLGTRHCSELLVGDEFQALVARHAGFRFVPTVDDDESGWDGTRGSVVANIDKSLAGLSSLGVSYAAHARWPRNPASA